MTYYAHGYMHTRAPARAGMHTRVYGRATPLTLLHPAPALITPRSLPVTHLYDPPDFGLSVAARGSCRGVRNDIRHAYVLMACKLQFDWTVTIIIAVVVVRHIRSSSLLNISKLDCVRRTAEFIPVGIIFIKLSSLLTRHNTITLIPLWYMSL